MVFWNKHDLKTNTSPDRTRNLARCRSFQTLVNFPKLTKKISQTVAQKTKHPADFSHEWRGAPDEENDLQKKGCDSPTPVIKISNEVLRNKIPAS